LRNVLACFATVLTVALGNPTLGNAEDSTHCARFVTLAAVIDREIASSLKGYSGTRATLEFCLANLPAGPEPTRAFLHCAGISCFVLGLDRCEAAGEQVLTMLLAGLRAEEERERLGCPERSSN
jgi:hypothetical protein